MITLAIVFVVIVVSLIRSCDKERDDLMTALKADKLPKLQCSIDELSKSTRANKVAALGKHKGVAISGEGTIYELDVGWANERKLSIAYQIADRTNITVFLSISEDSLDISKVFVGMTVAFRGALTDLQLLQDGTPVVYLEPAIILTDTH